MERYYLIVRCAIHMGRTVTDEDLKIMNCYYETPIFYADTNLENVEIVDKAFSKFCAGCIAAGKVESVELVHVTQ